MTRRERLMATLRGEAVDRPAVNFYEVGGFMVDTEDPDINPCGGTLRAVARPCGGHSRRFLGI